MTDYKSENENTKDELSDQVNSDLDLISAHFEREGVSPSSVEVLLHEQDGDSIAQESCVICGETILSPVSPNEVITDDNSSNRYIMCSSGRVLYYFIRIMLYFIPFYSILLPQVINFVSTAGGCNYRCK
jgi:hypothetical protein